MARRLIPFNRALKLGSKGDDVRAVKRGLARWNGSTLKGITPFYGPLTKRLMRKFQQRNGLTATGNYGKLTHAKLIRHFDDYAELLYTGTAPSKELKQRQKIVSSALYFYGIRGRVHYTQTFRRMQIVRERIRTLPVSVVKELYEDCSSFVTGLYYIAGAPDPNDRDYDGFGYTGTLCTKGKSVPLRSAKIGDLVFYGSGPPWGHVAVLVTDGDVTRPKVVSHGSEPGPYFLDVGYRADRGDVRSYL